LVVAADWGQLVGFAGVCQEGPLAVLTDCFVRPAAQSTGIGSALLDAVVPRSGPVATFASTDPRAVPSYARRRMLPRWPAFYLSATRERLVHLGRVVPRLSVVPAGADGLSMLVEANGDAECLASVGAVNLEVRDATGVIGAATVSAPSPFRLFDADGATITESSALGGRATDTVLAAVAWCAGTDSPNVSLQLAGTHEAFVPLLELGFRITDADTACASEEASLADPTCTTFWGEPLPSRAE
jgi:Acetyltransferase (GNAT) domain